MKLDRSRRSQCSKWYGVRLALKGVCICYEPDLVLTVAMHISKKSIKITFKNTSRVARSRGALVWDCASVFWRCLSSLLGPVFEKLCTCFCCVLTLACFLLQSEDFIKQPFATSRWFLNRWKLTHLVQLHNLMSPVHFCLWISPTNATDLLQQRNWEQQDAVTLMSEKTQTQILAKDFCWKLLSAWEFRLSAFKLVREPECRMAKLNQSARSTASKCPVAALLLMLNKWNDGSVVPLALWIYICRAMTKKTWRLSHSSNNYFPLHPSLGRRM